MDNREEPTHAPDRETAEFFNAGGSRSRGGQYRTGIAGLLVLIFLVIVAVFGIVINL